jgi:hypothetical protein
LKREAVCSFETLVTTTKLYGAITQKNITPVNKTFRNEGYAQLTHIQSSALQSIP